MPPFVEVQSVREQQSSYYAQKNEKLKNLAAQRTSLYQGQMLYNQFGGVLDRPELNYLSRSKQSMAH